MILKKIFKKIDSNGSKIVHFFVFLLLKKTSHFWCTKLERLSGDLNPVEGCSSVFEVYYAKS